MKAGRSYRQAYVIDALEARRLLATVPAGFTETTIANNLVTPTALTVAPDGRVFFTQIGGQVRLVKNNVVQSGNVISVTPDTAGERGLLGITLDPNFGAAGGASNYLYIYYSAKTPTIHNRVSRFLITGDTAGSEQQLIDLPTATDNVHQGGALNFGPDGKLYVSTGDMFNSANAQSLTSTNGKILRFNPDGTIPTNNPFVSQTTGINQSIWARGLRHAFTTAWQPASSGGAFYINDVGENSFEEINIGAAGANYGWPNTEGTFNQASFPNFTNPAYAYSHSVGQCIVGGAFYDGIANTFPSQYQGKYFFGDFVQGFIKYMDPSTKAVNNFATGAQYLVTLSVAPDGAIWYLRGGDQVSGGAGVGQLLRIQYTAAQAPSIVLHPQSQTIPTGEPVTFTVSATGSTPFTYQWTRNNVNINGATSASYTIPSVSAGDNGAQFRCIVTNSVNSATSNPATLTVTSNTRPTPTITSPVVGTLYGAGDTIDYSATATDAQDGTLAASQFTWRVDLLHDTHSHPFIAPLSGVKSGSFVIPATGHTEENVWYRITLTVTDSGGLTQTTFRDVNPRKANLTLNTNIAGLSVFLDGQPQTALPATTRGVEGVTRTLDAALTQVVGGVTYQFVAWNDGGAANHTIGFPSADQTITAYYKRVPTSTTYLSDLSWTGTPTNGWGPVEKDRSNGESGATDGATIKLNGVTYTKGLGTHAASSITYSFAAGTYARFLSDVGIDDEITSGGSVVFQVFNGTTSLYDSGTMTATSATKSIDIAVPASATSLRFVVTDGGNGNTDDHADWAGARFTNAAASQLTINGTNSADDWLVRMSSDRTALVISRNQTITHTIPIGTYDTINFIGLGGTDQLYIALLYGPLVGVDVITFDAGTSSGTTMDKIGVLGRSAADTIDVSDSGVFIGAVAYLYSNVEVFGVSEGTGADTFNFNTTTDLDIEFFSENGAQATLAFHNGENALDIIDAGLSSFTKVRVDNDATLNVVRAQHMGSLSMTGNAKVVLTPNTGRLLDIIGPLSITGNAAIDLTNNDFIASGPSRAAIEAYLLSRAIFSSTADAASNTALGLLTGAEYQNSNGSNRFDGEPYATTDILVKYTYFGDVDFNGQVDVSDYNLIDFGFASHLQGWSNGDVDGNGSVDASDYNLIDFAFATQTGIL